mgnify:FL=1
MSRRRGKKAKVVNAKKTKLVTALETGKSIKGMQGFVNINKQCDEDETLFVPVKVEGLKTADEDDGNYCNCGDLLVAGIIVGLESKLYFKVEDWVEK